MTNSMLRITLKKNGERQNKHNSKEELLIIKISQLHTVLFVATRRVPGIDTPAPPPIVIPFKRATYREMRNEDKITNQ